MALIEKRRLRSGKYSYRARVKYHGRSLSSTHNDRHSAERWAAQATERLRDETYFAGEANRNRPLLELFDRYEQSVLPGKRNASNQKLHLAYWRSRLGSTTVGDVSRALISQYRDELGAPQKDGRLRAPATVVRYLATLSHVFTVAIGDWEWASINPVRGIRKPKEPRGRDRYLSEQERDRLLRACRASASPDLYAAVLLALCTGMRRGEIMTLEWGDIDFEREIITLRHTKNGSKRAVPLCSPALEVIAERSKVRHLDTALVFPSDHVPQNKSKTRQPRDITKPWETARHKAGLVDFRFHDLRHSAASYLAMSGATTLQIAEILGHKTLQMTKRYSHLSVDHLRDVMQRVSIKAGAA